MHPVTNNAFPFFQLPESLETYLWFDFQKCIIYELDIFYVLTFQLALFYFPILISPSLRVAYLFSFFPLVYFCKFLQILFIVTRQG